MKCFNMGLVALFLLFVWFYRREIKAWWEEL